MKNQIEIVKQSYGRCLMAEDFIGRFYDIFLISNTSIKPLFANTNFEEQKKRLRHGINCIIMFAADNVTGQSCLTRLRRTHNKENLNISPKLYPYWKESLLKTIEELDREVKEEVLEAWGNIIDIGINYISAGYDVNNNE